MTRDEAITARAAAADELESRLAAALRSVRELLSLARSVGFTTAEQQEQLRAARALLVEEERHGA